MYFTTSSSRTKVSQQNSFKGFPDPGDPFVSYLHINGFIHRDVKAANLLINDDGTVLLGDLGVAADLTEDSSQHMHSNSGKCPATPTQTKRSVAFDDRPAKRIGKRKSFVGTVCLFLHELDQIN